jgi:hypothetical protein
VQTPDMTDAAKVARKQGVDNSRTYSWFAQKKGDTGVGERTMKTVSLKVDEGAVGTNVEYAGKIERLDSYLYWSAKNINRNVGEYFRQIAKRNQKKYKK